MGPPAGTGTTFLPAIAALFAFNAHAQVLPPFVYRVSLPLIAVPQVPVSILPDQTASTDQTAAATVLSEDEASNLVSGAGRQAAPPHKPDCPYCDSSVYPYCSDKLLHDACCCLSPYDTGLPAQCQLADCSFLHANSCKEHRLITRCCCDRRLLFANRI